MATPLPPPATGERMAADRSALSLSKGKRPGRIREPSCSPCLCMSAVGLAEADASSMPAVALSGVEGAKAGEAGGSSLKKSGGQHAVAGYASQARQS